MSCAPALTALELTSKGGSLKLGSIDVNYKVIKKLLNYKKAFDFAVKYVFFQGSVTESLIFEMEH